MDEEQGRMERVGSAELVGLGVGDLGMEHRGAE